MFIEKTWFLSIYKIFKKITIFYKNDSIETILILREKMKKYFEDFLIHLYVILTTDNFKFSFLILRNYVRRFSDVRGNFDVFFQKKNRKIKKKMYVLLIFLWVKIDPYRPVKVNLSFYVSLFMFSMFFILLN